MSEEITKKMLPSTGRAIGLLLRLQAVRTRNKMTQGRDKTGVLGWLGLLFLIMIVVVMFYDFTGSILELAGQDQSSFLLFINTIIILLFFAVEFSFNAKDAGSTEKDTIWLMTLPLPMSTILLMKIVRTAFFNVAGTILLLPLISILTYHSLGLKAVLPVVMIVYIPLVFALATLVNLMDMVMGLIFRPKIRKFINFFSSIVLFFSYAALYFLHFSLDNGMLLKRVLSYSKSLSFLEWNPLSTAPNLLLIYTEDPSQGLLSFFWFVLSCVLIVVTGGITMNQLTQKGFREKSESRERGKKIGSSWQIRGVVGKELLLLYREKRLWFSLLLPMLMIAMNQFVQGIEITNTRDVIIQGFFVGLWLPMSAIPVLVLKERESMWIAFTLPQTLSEQLFRKMILWAVIAACASLITIVGYLMIYDMPFSLVHKIALVPLLIFCISSIFYSLRLANLDFQVSLGSQNIGKMGMGTMYLLIGSGFMALYSDDAVQSFLTLFLFIALAMTLWQKYSHKFSYLLDRDHQPRLEIALEHGIMAVLGFLVLQTVIFVVLTELESTNFLILISFGVAGFLVYALSAYYFWYNQAQNTAQIFWLQAPRSWFLAAKNTVLFSVIALSIRVLYQPVVQYVNTIVDDSPPSASTFTEYALGAIVLAPFFEEIIFRGMVYGGLRKDRGVLFSAVMSSLVFALIHPTISWPPVFALGVCCAYAYEKTQSLLPSIIIHFLFNVVAIVLSLNLVSS